jgi:hypothetical protein
MRLNGIKGYKQNRNREKFKYEKLFIFDNYYREKAAI